MKTDLCMAMKINEQRKEMEKKNEAYQDELHKVGPPMMQEIDFNQKRLADQHAKINNMQGKDNFKLMATQKDQAVKK